MSVGLGTPGSLTVVCGGGHSQAVSGGSLSAQGGRARRVGEDQ